MATPTKKTAPKKVAPKKRQPVNSNETVARLKEKLTAFEVWNKELKKKLEFAESFLLAEEKARAEERKQPEPSLVQKPCPKCQILSIFEDLSESQINSVMRDIQDEIIQSRQRRLNRLKDKVALARDKADAFDKDCNSNETYN